MGIVEWGLGGAAQRKALFAREVHGIKRGLFWQTNPCAVSSLVAGCSAVQGHGIAARESHEVPNPNV